MSLNIHDKVKDDLTTYLPHLPTWTGLCDSIGLWDISKFYDFSPFKCTETFSWPCMWFTYGSHLLDNSAYSVAQWGVVQMPVRSRWLIMLSVSLLLAMVHVSEHWSTPGWWLRLSKYPCSYLMCSRVLFLLPNLLFSVGCLAWIIHSDNSECLSQNCLFL